LTAHQRIQFIPRRIKIGSQIINKGSDDEVVIISTGKYKNQDPATNKTIKAHETIRPNNPRRSPKKRKTNNRAGMTMNK